LYRGSALDLRTYSRAELSGSDHKPGLFACTPNQLTVFKVFLPVFAIYRAEIKVIDPVKRATLSRMILDSVTSTEPGELLDQKLANITLPVGLGERKCLLLYFHSFCLKMYMT
jgi:hypothetical protein